MNGARLTLRRLPEMALRSAPLSARVAVKHFLDWLGAVVLLILLAPILLLIAILIYLGDRGPVFFQQDRAGRYARPFRLVKFRTMVVDADRFLDATGRPTRERVTRVGRFLRRWSLDELPQFYNVLKGDMSFVGPRPVPLQYAERMNAEQRKRFAVRPGITGLAQVSGRHRQPWSKRLILDAEYVDRYSLLLDLKILLRTFGAVIDSETLVERGDPRKVDIG